MKILKRVLLILGSYFMSFFAYVLMESSKLFCPNKLMLLTTIHCVDYLWKAIVWTLFYFILVLTLYFVERKYINSWKSLILLFAIPTIWSIYVHIGIINMSKNADGMGCYVYNAQEIWIVLFLNVAFLFGFLSWFKKGMTK